jgi:non-canonical purine NTP pyrophosphatase (RdgB/HAM1 family)
MPPTQILIATTNLGKLREYQALTEPSALPIAWLTLSDVGLANSDVEETGTTFAENAALKARTYQQMANLPTIADDSGLVVDALNGAPGVYSARYAPTVAERNAKLIAALAGVAEPQRSAHFVCVTAFVAHSGHMALTEGKIEGHIGFTPRGEHGFGYDPLLVLADGRSLAELLPEEKNQISHRGRAMQAMMPILAAWLPTVNP